MYPMFQAASLQNFWYVTYDTGCGELHLIGKAFKSGDVKVELGFPEFEGAREGRSSDGELTSKKGASVEKRGNFHGRYR